MSAKSMTDESLGPQLGPAFDFALLFEQTTLTILPSALLLLCAPIYIYRVTRKPVCARSGWLLWVKLIGSFLLFGVEVANLTLWRLSLASVSAYTTSLVAAALSCASAVCVGALFYTEHRHSPRPSTLLSLYLTVSLLFEAIKTRSLFRRDGLLAESSLSAAATGLRLFLLIVAEISKRSLLHEFSRVAGPEETSGFWGRSLFLWLHSVFRMGFRGCIKIDDLQDSGTTFTSVRLLSKFEDAWSKEDKTSKESLTKACLRALKWPLLTAVFPRLCLIAFTFAQPFLLQNLVVIIGRVNLSHEAIASLFGATIIIYLGIGISKVHYLHSTYRFMTMLRGCLISAMYKKTLRLNASQLKEVAAMTLMSADMDGIEMGLSELHNVWASILELVLGIYLLAKIVGGACFLVIVPGFISAIASFEIARRTGPAHVAWNQKTETRVSAISNILSQLKSIKTSGLGCAIADSIQTLRVIEIDQSKTHRILWIGMQVVASVSSNVTPVVVIAGGLFWTMFSGQLNATEAFTTLSIVALASRPLATLLRAYPQIASALGCFRRIQEFLLLGEVTDQRTIGHAFWSKSAMTEASSDKQSTRTRSGGEDTRIKRTRGTRSMLTLKPDRSVAELKNATIALRTGSEAVLKSVNVKLMPCNLIMVVGPIASGKTTLLKALLGEAHVMSGSVFVEYRAIAFCDQVPWLRNASIRDNILCLSPYDHDWYQSVIYACCLEEDLQALDQGDESMAGSDGMNISGGQKQRIALARAVYSRRPIMILDDVLSSLDATTSKIILSRLFAKNGLLKRTGTTVVMATHAREHLFVADSILELDGAGHISERLVLANPRARVPFQDEMRIVNEKRTGISHFSEPFQQSDTFATSSQLDKLEDEEIREIRKGDVALYAFYLSSIGKALFGVWLVTVAVSAVSEKLPQIWIRVWLENNAKNNRYFIGYACFGVMSSLLFMAMLAFYLLKLVPISAETLHRMLLDAVMKANLGYFSSIDTGSLLNRFSQDMTLISQVLPMSVANVSYVAFCALADLAVIAAGADYAAAIIPVFAFTLYFLQKYYLRTSRQMRHLDLGAIAPLCTQFTETAAGMQHIRAFGWQADILAQSLRLLDRSQKPHYYMFCIQRWLMLVLDLCVLGVAVVLVAFALNFAQTTSKSAIGLALVHVIGFSENLSDLIEAWMEVETSLGALSRLRRFLEKTSPKKDSGANAYKLPEQWPQRGAIRLDSVTARYGCVSKAPVLHNVSATIEPGQKVGIVGRSGSGKSSFILVLLGLIEHSGSVTIDGVDISRIDNEHVRTRVTVLPQDPILLPGSVRHNLVPQTETSAGQPAVSEAAMVEALCSVGLIAHVASRGGLDADLASMDFSQGQKQLLSLVRAVLHHGSTNSQIVLLDEATSSLDRETEARMQAFMAEAFAGCTRIVVAHRPEAIQDADVVFELSAGKLIRTSRRQGIESVGKINEK
ncbi:hypothetical protein HIM_06636 [Hirsutella minnesotensis 3608]|uniref:ABC transporter n=1 Tax=Hirsutella minnesotensis 3608 TaxID=1043627 RepID=A0A0F7ZTZ4_9HYPO|nr:hypothetical protein HIM_06636 [Hirsutella minnesotensis 3608]